MLLEITIGQRISKFEEKFAQVKNLLEDKYNFKLIKQKKDGTISTRNKMPEYKTQTL